MQGTIRTRVRALVAGGVAVALSGLAVGVTTSTVEAAAPSAQKAADVTGWSVYGSKDVVTSKGKKLRVTVNAYGSPGGDASVSGGLQTRSGAYESHSWSFGTAKSGVKLNAKLLGTVEISAGKTAKYLALDLTVKKAGAIKKSKCQGQVSSKYRKVVLVGKVMVNTKAGWGKLSKKGFKIPGTSYRSFDVNCDSTFENACSSGISWSVSEFSLTGSSSVSGNTSGKTSYSSAFRTAEVKGTSGTRFDSYGSRKAKKAVLDAANKKLTAYSDGGSGTLQASSAPGESSYDCKKAGENKKTEVKSWYDAELTNGGTPLRIRSQLYGDIKFPNGTSAYFTQYRTVDA